MTRLHLVRHGPTHAKTMVGWSDLPADLSDTAAINRLARHIPARAIFVSSDLSRAIATADAIQMDRHRLPHVPDLREIHFGEWELRRFDDIEAEDPHHIRAFWETPGEIRAPGGEGWNELRARTDDAVDRLIQAHTGKDIAIVAHFGMILTQVQRALGIDTPEVFAHRIDNLSVTTILVTPGSWGVESINHLP